MSRINTIEEFLKRYQYDPIEDRLGKGGFGSVYKAHDSVRHRDVAIKIAEVKTSSNGKKSFSLRDEVMAVSKLPDHPNVAHYEKDELYTFTLSNGVFDYAIMQFYPDGNLSDVIKNGMNSNQKEDVAYQLLEGIAFLHEHKVVHRDLKPANVLVVKQGKSIIPIIIDFGLSKSVDDTLFSNSFSGGTQRYSAPEQLQGGQPLKFNVDLWSYGAIIFELFTGKPLFDVGSDAFNSEQVEKEIYDNIVNGKLPSFQKMPDKWQKVVKRCLVVDPQKRAQGADELFDIIGEKEGVINVNNNKIKKYIKVGSAITAIVTLIIAIVVFWPEPKPPVESEDSKQFFACKEVNDYRLYLKDFPKGKHIEEASRFIESFVNDSIAHKQQVFTVNGVSFTMKYVEGGTFMMGSEDFAEGKDEQPAHLVSVGDFYIGETEVTQALWKTLMGSNPSQIKGDSLPVESVSWTDCQELCFKLNVTTRIDSTGMAFRLPTEAEWEFAARGGKKSKGYKYSGSDNIDSVAWHNYNANGTTHPVGEKKPNELGLYDMSGNVWEWCLDVYDCYPNGTKESLKGKRTILYRVLRGGSWYYKERAGRVSARGNCEPNKKLSSGGMRLVLSSPIDIHAFDNMAGLGSDNIPKYKPTVTLSYGEWQGKSINGKPDGEGKLVMMKSHSFGGQKVEAGMVIEALFENGELITGKVYNKNGELINTIMP